MGCLTNNQYITTFKNILEFKGQEKPELFCYNFEQDINKILNPLELDNLNTMLEFQERQVALVEEITSLIGNGTIVL